MVRDAYSISNFTFELADSDVANQDIKFFWVKPTNIVDIDEFRTSIPLECRIVGMDRG